MRAPEPDSTSFSFSLRPRRVASGTAREIENDRIKLKLPSNVLDNNVGRTVNDHRVHNLERKTLKLKKGGNFQKFRMR